MEHQYFEWICKNMSANVVWIHLGLHFLGQHKLMSSHVLVANKKWHSYSLKNPKNPDRFWHTQKKYTYTHLLVAYRKWNTYSFCLSGHNLEMLLCTQITQALTGHPQIGFGVFFSGLKRTSVFSVCAAT